MAQADLQRKGLAASDRARNARIEDAIANSEAELEEEIGTLVGFDPSRPGGAQWQIATEGGGIRYGEPITPLALTPGRKVAVYIRGGSCLFDGM